MQLGQHLSDVGGAGSQLTADSRQVRVLDICPQRLHPWPVRGSAFALVAATGEHLRAAQPCVRSEFVTTARLADSGLTGEKHETAAARERIVDRPAAQAPGRSAVPLTVAPSRVGSGERTHVT